MNICMININQTIINEKSLQQMTPGIVFRHTYTCHKLTMFILYHKIYAHVNTLTQLGW